MGDQAHRSAEERRLTMNLIPLHLVHDAGFNTPKKKALENARHNTSRAGVEWFLPGERGKDGRAKQPKGDVMIVGGGPSLAGSIRAIKRRHRAGMNIIALNGAAKHLMTHGITPDAVVVLDARPENLTFVQGTPDSMVHLIASQCDPSLFDELTSRDARVILWHGQFCAEQEAELLELLANGAPVYAIPGGSTVLLRTLRIAMDMGFDRLHLYGCDSSYKQNTHHAYSQPLNAGEETLEVVWPVNMRSYRVAAWMARQVEEFWLDHKFLHEKGVKVIAHGGGFLPDVCAWLNKQVAA